MSPLVTFELVNFGMDSKRVYQAADLVTGYVTYCAQHLLHNYKLYEQYCVWIFLYRNIFSFWWKNCPQKAPMSLWSPTMATRLIFLQTSIRLWVPYEFYIFLPSLCTDRDNRNVWIPCSGEMVPSTSHSMHYYKYFEQMEAFVWYCRSAKCTHFNSFATWYLKSFKENAPTVNIHSYC
jgi:hypothetical protein